MSKIYCLMTQGVPLTDYARTTLYLMACQMYNKDQRSFTLQAPEADTVINVKTNYNFSCIGSLSGTEFFGVVESGKQTTRARFLVRNFDFREAFLGPAEWEISDLKSSPEVKAQNN